MNIEYKITEYFEKNKLFDNNTSKGIKITNDFNSLLIKGTSRDLVELADLLVNLALNKTKGAHLHIDELNLLNNNSDFNEVVLEKISNN